MRSFAAGFKRARKKKGYTQDGFCKAFNEYRADFAVPIYTVRNWEQGRSIPEWKTIEILCDFFECDVDYLFNTIEQTTHDIAFICGYTGLSEETIKNLHYLSRLTFPDEEGALFLDFLNFIVSDNQANEQFFRMNHYLESALYTRLDDQEIQRLSRKVFLGSLTLIELSVGLNKIGFNVALKEDISKFHMLEAEKAFSKMIELYIDNAAKKHSFSYEHWAEYVQENPHVSRIIEDITKDMSLVKKTLDDE